MQFPTSFHLVAELTNRCNFSCLHCFRTNNVADEPDLPVELYEKFLKEACSYRSPNVTLTGGGEPTLHREFDAILAATAKYGYSFKLVTNGWAFEQIYPLLLTYRKNLYAVVFSLDGATQKTHDMIRHQQGAFQRVIQACMLCYYKQIPFALTLTVNRLNMKEIEEVLELAEKLGADEVNLGVAQLTETLVSKGFALSPQERKQIQEKIFDVAESAAIPVNPAFDFFLENPCFVCKPLQMSSLVLDYLGRMRFCCQLSGYQSPAEFKDVDVVGDLRLSSVWECHRRLVKKVAEFQNEKIQRVEANTLTANDYFPCFYCANYFHKLDWLKDFPDSEWAK